MFLRGRLVRRPPERVPAQAERGHLQSAAAELAHQPTCRSPFPSEVSLYNVPPEHFLEQLLPAKIDHRFRTEEGPNGDHRFPSPRL